MWRDVEGLVVHRFKSPPEGLFSCSGDPVCTLATSFRAHHRWAVRKRPRQRQGLAAVGEGNGCQATRDVGFLHGTKYSVQTFG
jgi:hypothetical protein